MPTLTLPLVNGHPILDVTVGVTASRGAALRAASFPVAAPVPAQALVDTGAAISCIDPAIRQGLNLTPFALRTVAVPANPHPVRAYYFKVSLTNIHPSGNAQLDLNLPLWDVAETQLVQTGQSALIGCDVLALCEMHFDGPGGIFRLFY
jgi:hypothetical protein